MDRDQQAFAGAAVRPEPVVAVTITCNLGGERQMQLAAHFNRDASEEEQNAILDRVMRTADRQKARYDLEKLEENFNLCGLNTRNVITAMGAAESELKTRVARLKIELVAKEEARKDVHDEAYQAHAKDRSGPFVPKGHILQRLNAMDLEIANARAAVEAAPKDAEQERAKLIASIQRNQEDLRIRRKQINDLRQLAGLSPNTEFTDAETAEV